MRPNVALAIVWCSGFAFGLSIVRTPAEFGSLCVLLLIVGIGLALAGMGA